MEYKDIGIRKPEFVTKTQFLYNEVLGIETLPQTQVF